MKRETFIIAEAGVNHNGSMQLAYEMVEQARIAGVNAIKFQTFKAESLVSKFAQMASYQKKNTNSEESQLSMLRKLELTYDNFRELKSHCDKAGILFISTPFDFDSIDFLNDLEIPLWKVPSGEVTNLLFLEKIAQTRKEVILSTGMSTLDEIAAAVEVLSSCRKITLLHCSTIYPTPLESVNLAAMETMKDRFSMDIGYSDHTLGIEISLVAVGMGAKIIEKHFTLDKNMEGPDHKASLNPEELKALVEGIRRIEIALGDGVKSPTPAERDNMLVARRSIVAKKAIEKGDVFSKDNLTIKRPGIGISPMEWYNVIGKISNRDYEEDEIIEK